MKIRQQFLFILIFALFLLGNTWHFMLPQVFTSTKIRHPSSDTKSNLHNMYLGCHAFWADEGDSKTCTVSMVANEEYGYIQSHGVKIYGSGTKNDFCAVAWHQGNSEIFKMDSTGQIKEHLDKIWIYEQFFPRHFVYYSCVLILPIATMFLTSWAGGYLILERKRKFPILIHIGIIFGWLFIVLITSGFAGSDYFYYVFGGPFGFFLGIPVIYSISRAFSLIGWGNQIERAKDLPDYLENHSAKKLQKSGSYLLGVVGVLLALNFIYSSAYTKYKENYRNQSVTFSEEIQSSIQTDTSQIQKMCRNL